MPRLGLRVANACAIRARMAAGGRSPTVIEMLDSDGRAFIVLFFGFAAPLCFPSRQNDWKTDVIGQTDFLVAHAILFPSAIDFM